MRNLVLLNKGEIVPEPRTCPGLVPVDAVFDTISDTVTICLRAPGSSEIEVQQYMKDGRVQVLASFAGPAAPLLSFGHFVDATLLVFVFANGDLITAQYGLYDAPDGHGVPGLEEGSYNAASGATNVDFPAAAIELVGSIDAGISAAKWAPDEESLALVTADQNVVVLSRQLEPIAERPLDPQDILVADAKHVSVGWGTAETQFRGKGARALEREREATRHAIRHAGAFDLKEDAELRDPTVAPVQRGTASSFDPGSARISWRGDGEFFAVSTLENAELEATGEHVPRRVVRVFSREAELDSVSQPADGLEHNVSWRPSGSLIAQTQRTVDEDGDATLQVSFFERNGLPHGDFATRLDPCSEDVRAIEWSCNSDTLALQLRDRVQIWTTKNYHWYLKQELYVTEEGVEAGEKGAESAENGTEEKGPEKGGNGSKEGENKQLEQCNGKGRGVQNETSFIRFHPEKPLSLMVGTSAAGVWMYNFAHKTACGPTLAGMDVGMAVVLDGCDVKVTPLGVANVPPPVAFREYEFSAPLCDVAVNAANDVFAMVSSRQDVHLCAVSVAKMKQHTAPRQATIPAHSLARAGGEMVKQVCFIGCGTVAVLIDTPGSSRVELWDVTRTDSESGPIPDKGTSSESILDFESRLSSADLGARAVLIKSASDFSSAVVECIDGSLYQVSAAGEVSYLANFPVLCHDFEAAIIGHENSDDAALTTREWSKDEDKFGEDPWGSENNQQNSQIDSQEHAIVALGLSGSGKLYANATQLATGVTSIKVTQDHLVMTNAHSQVCFVHLKTVHDPATFSFLQTQDAVGGADERIRQIERGSFLVTCIPSNASVVLQAPRGNLETICPRIMVLSGVRKHIANLQYRDAFVACRTHRIDLDLLHDYDPSSFLAHVELFVQQIGRSDYLDLFVSCLHEEDVTATKYRDTLVGSATQNLAALTIDKETPNARRMVVNKEQVRVSSKINTICNAVLDVLARPQYEAQFLQTRVTALACQAPPNLAGALELISSLHDDDAHEKAITHLCFLADVNKLYDHALQLYDVKMALNIAQKSQKDPKEYLPFLQNLHVQTPLRRQFLIDDYLKHFTKALRWLHELGLDAEAEVDEYVVKHALYKDALAIYKYDDARNKQILSLYADYLFDERKYSESAIILEYLGKQEQALESYVLCKRWKEALAIAQALPEHELVVATAERLSSMLVDDHKYSDAAEIELRILGNVEEAVRLHCKSYQYDSAIFLAVEKSQLELIDSVVDAQLDEGFGVIAELVADCTSQAHSQLKRLRELRQKKEEDPYAFYGIPNDDLDTPDNVSIAASETSTTPSFFTKYTGKTSGTAKTGASRKTSKNRKREERKRAKGRKGTIYEEEYLIKSVGRLVERLDQTEADALRLIEGLSRRRKMQQAYQIQNNWRSLTSFLKEHIEEIHNMSEKDRERIDDNGEVYLIEEIPAPKIRDFPKLEMLDY